MSTTQEKDELYVVIDRISGLRVSGAIPALNEAGAISGFLAFCAGQEKQGLNKAMYELRMIGYIAQDGEITQVSPSHFICTGENAADVLKEWTSVKLAQLEESEEDS